MRESKCTQNITETQSKPWGTCLKDEFSLRVALSCIIIFYAKQNVNTSSEYRFAVLFPACFLSQLEEQLSRVQREKNDLQSRMEEDQEDMNELMKKHKAAVAQVTLLVSLLHDHLRQYIDSRTVFYTA